MVQPVRHRKQPQPPRSLHGGGVVVVLELFSPLAVRSRRA
jgi:hypothetical protein